MFFCSVRYTHIMLGIGQVGPTTLIYFRGGQTANRIQRCLFYPEVSLLTGLFPEIGIISKQADLDAVRD